MSNGHLLFESIFERKLSSDDTHAYLEKITEEYPYFSPAQFFLLLNTVPDAPAYQQLAARTNVLFNNAHWLQFRLQEEREVLEQPQEVIDKTLGQIEPPFITNQEPIDALNDSEFISQTVPEAIDEPLSVAEEISGPQDLPVVIPEEPVDFVITDNASLPAVPVATDPVQESVERADVEDVMEVMPIQVDQPVNAEVSLSSPAAAEGLPVEKIWASSEESDDNTSASGEDESETMDTPHSLHFNNQSTPLVNETEKEEDISAEQEIAPLHFKLNLETPATTEDTITFEPLHTSDYFASQGIKLGTDIKPNDKLGKQLKSFTEWLKTMKKVHNDQLPPLSGKADQSIQKLAEQSNKDDTVLTEAMANVLLRQGKAEKAREVYEKLSLLNPSKSTYFAAKIDQLKEH